MRNHICLITLYAFTYILYSCSIEQEYNSFNIIYCKEVSSGLQYNNSCGTIEYRGEKKNYNHSNIFVNFTFFSKKGLCNSGLKAKSTTFECC